MKAEELAKLTTADKMGPEQEKQLSEAGRAFAGLFGETSMQQERAAIMQRQSKAIAGGCSMGDLQGAAHSMAHSSGASCV